MRSDTITMERELAEAEAELAALRAKAAAFDVLSERIASGAWSVRPQFSKGLILTDIRTGEQFYANTLAEAVRLAMEAEGR